MEVGTDLYSALCVSEASEPAHGEAKIGLGTTMQIICLFFRGGGENGKWIFITFFKCNVYPSSLRGYISVMNQVGNSKFKR